MATGWWLAAFEFEVVASPSKPCTAGSLRRCAAWFFLETNLGSHQRAFHQFLLLDVQAMPVNSGMSWLLGRIATVPDHACWFAPFRPCLWTLAWRASTTACACCALTTPTPRRRSRWALCTGGYLEVGVLLTSDCGCQLRVGDTRSPEVEDQVRVWHWFGQHLQMDGCASCCTVPHGAAPLPAACHFGVNSSCLSGFLPGVRLHQQHLSHFSSSSFATLISWPAPTCAPTPLLPIAGVHRPHPGDRQLAGLEALEGALVGPGGGAEGGKQQRQCVQKGTATAVRSVCRRGTATAVCAELDSSGSACRRKPVWGRMKREGDEKCKLSWPVVTTEQSGKECPVRRPAATRAQSPPAGHLRCDVAPVVPPYLLPLTTAPSV